MDLESLYQEIILDHYKHPRGKGLREPYAVEVHHVNPTCGDEITLRVEVEGDKVADVSFDGMGCSISQASASVLYDLVVGGIIRPPEVVLGPARPARVKTANCLGIYYGEGQGLDALHG